MKVLAGDLGGTKTLLAVLERQTDGGFRSVAESRYTSGDFTGLEAMVETFLGEIGAAAAELERACFGVAGPVQAREQGDGQRARITNLPWELDSAALAAATGIARLRLINDFQAVGYGIEALGPRDLHVLQEGREVAGGNRAVLGAGTGLGQAILPWCGSGYEVLATEGGHADFAPADEEQMGLLRFLRREFHHVSYERLVSGQGLLNIHRYLAAAGVEVSEPLARAMDQGDPAAALSEFGMMGTDRSAERALDLFVAIYGAQAGNLALASLAAGGVYLAGGIAPKILPRLIAGGFLKAFTAKGRMAHLLEAMPVRVVLNSKVGLLGAAVAATRL